MSQEGGNNMWLKVFDASAQYFRTFIRQIIGLKNAPFHDELDNNLANPLHKKIVVTFPRGHGKSTHISVAYPLWKISEDHNIRILLISSTAQIAKSFLREIIGHIERNDIYKSYAEYLDLKKGKKNGGVFPRMKNYRKMQDNWSGDSIIIERDDLRVKDPTINAIGLFGSIVSKRADIIICDDVVNQENSATEAQRLKVIDWIYTTVMPVLVPGGTFIYLGNTWHQDDLVSRLMKDPQFDFKKRMPSIIKEATNETLWTNWARLLMDESKTVEVRKSSGEEFYQANKDKMDEGVQVLWPERFTYKDLYLMRLANPYSFSRMYQCDPSNRPDQRFRDEWLEFAVRKGAHLKLQDQPREGLVMEVTASGLDLAISTKEGSDDVVLLTIDRVKWGQGVIQPGDYVIRNIKRGKFSPNEVRNMVKECSEKVRPDGIRVESVGYQEAMVRDLADLGIVGIHGYHTGGEKHDPDIGLNSLALLCEMGKLVLPYDPMDPQTTMLISQLMNEMRAWPDGHTGDSLMALWFAVSEIRDLSGDKLVIPAPTTIETKNIQDPNIRQEEEKKVDLAMAMEQEAERAQFKEMMNMFR